MGDAWCNAIRLYIPGLIKNLQPDVVIANGENAANGRGITAAHCRNLHSLGVDCITSGNHIWDQDDTAGYIQQTRTLLRPANYPAGAPGNGLYLHEFDARTLAIVNLIGRRFMQPVDDPFDTMSRILDALNTTNGRPHLFVDFHAEAASEKMAFAHRFDGSVSAVIGTHTHVPTADARILPGGTAYMTDVGMTGDYDSIVGIRKDSYLQHLSADPQKQKLIPANRYMTLCGVLVTLAETGRAEKIQPLRLGDSLIPSMPDTRNPVEARGLTD